MIPEKRGLLDCSGLGSLSRAPGKRRIAGFHPIDARPGVGVDNLFTPKRRFFQPRVQQLINLQSGFYLSDCYREIGKGAGANQMFGPAFSLQYEKNCSAPRGAVGGGSTDYD